MLWFGVPELQFLVSQINAISFDLYVNLYLVYIANMESGTWSDLTSEWTSVLWNQARYPHKEPLILSASWCRLHPCSRVLSAPTSFPLVEVHFFGNLVVIVPFVPAKALSLCGSFPSLLVFQWLSFPSGIIIIIIISMGFLNSESCNNCPPSGTPAGYMFKNYGPSTCIYQEQWTFYTKDAFTAAEVGFL